MVVAAHVLKKKTKKQKWRCGHDWSWGCGKKRGSRYGAEAGLWFLSSMHKALVHTSSALNDSLDEKGMGRRWSCPC